MELAYRHLGGNRHQHGELIHSHPHDGPHTHAHDDHPSHEHDHQLGRRHAHRHDHGHSHGLIHHSIRRSRAGLKAVALSLAILAATALAQVAIFVFTDSIALLADLIHNFGDAAPAIPLGIAFLLRSERAEGIAGCFVVLAIFVSAAVATYEAVVRLIEPRDVEYLGALAAAGLTGYAGNWLAAIVRIRVGHALDSPALVADGNHAKADAYISLGVVASAVALALGVQVADPLIGLVISALIMRITWQSWRTVRDGLAHAR